jgi:hypothetical protein
VARGYVLTWKLWYKLGIGCVAYDEYVMDHVNCLMCYVTYTCEFSFGLNVMGWLCN